MIQFIDKNILYSSLLLVVGELRKRLQAAAVQVADILDAVLHHRESGQAQTEREAGVLFGVDAALFEHLGVDHAAGAQLQPAGVVAGGAACLTAADQAGDIQLKAGFDEGEKSGAQESPYDAVKLGINYRDREALYERINRRVDLMLEHGLLEETRRVLGEPLSFTSAKAIGYKELAPYFNHEKSLEECIETLKRETRRYAKRQLTWFKRDSEINWLYADDYASFEELESAAAGIIEKGLNYG